MVLALTLSGIVFALSFKFEANWKFLSFALFSKLLVIPKPRITKCSILTAIDLADVNQGTGWNRDVTD